MEVFLGRVTQQAMNYAIRSGVGLAASYAIRQSNKLLGSAPKSSARDELFILQQRLQHKISIISPAIDMIELISARGNTSLATAIALTKELRREIHYLGQRMAHAVTVSEQNARSSRVTSQMKAEHEVEMKLIISDIKKLLERIEDALPLISLAITTSGATLSTSLPRTVSPSRLLQASTLLTAGDTQYSMTTHQAVQIGPTFTLTVYMLFAGHDRPQNEEDIRETTWKEVVHKAKVKLRRVPLDMVAGTVSGSDALTSVEIKSPFSGPGEADIPADARADEFAYQLMIVEDFDDDRMHDFEEDQPQPGQFDDVTLAGIREMIPVHEVSRIFYADTSKVLNIGTDSETNHPVLLLKRDLNAVPPRRTMERESPDPDPEPNVTPTKEQEQDHLQSPHTNGHNDPWRLPASLDPEWIAFEVYTESEPDDCASDPDDDTSRLEPKPSLEDSISKLNICPSPEKGNNLLPTASPAPWVNNIKTTLSLLELLLRLTALQQFQQQSHLSITDELLNFFLEESASTGAGGDENYRREVRMEARRRVGWDPYDESPVKRRGEEYQYGDQGQGSREDDYQRRYTSMSPGPYGGGWNSSPGMGVGVGGSGSRTRSIARVSEGHSPSPESPSPSPVPLSSGSGNGKGRTRTGWLKRQGASGEGRLKGSPLRPSTGLTDEGLGTSPASGLDVGTGGRAGVGGDGEGK